MPPPERTGLDHGEQLPERMPSTRSAEIEELCEKIEREARKIALTANAGERKALARLRRAAKSGH